MTEAELKDHLDAAEKSPKQIAAAVSGLPEKTLRYKSYPDKWCILEILGHLADIEILYAYRIRQMLADNDPVIAPIDQDEFAARNSDSDCLRGIEGMPSHNMINFWFFRSRV